MLTKGADLNLLIQFYDFIGVILDKIMKDFNLSNSLETDELATYENGHDVLYGADDALDNVMMLSILGLFLIK